MTGQEIIKRVDFYNMHRIDIQINASFNKNQLTFCFEIESELVGSCHNITGRVDVYKEYEEAFKQADIMYQEQINRKGYKFVKKKPITL